MGTAVDDTSLFYWLAQTTPPSNNRVIAVVPLTAIGASLMRPDGTYFKYRAVTAFRAPELYLLGELNWLEEYYGWCHEMHGNTLRVFGMWANTGYGPHNAPHYYDQLEAFFIHAKEANFYIHFVALCDQVEGSSVLLSETQRETHVRQCLEIARRVGNVFFEIENESWKNGNDANANRFPSSLFTGQLAMRSSWPETDPPSDPSLGGWLSMGTKHLERTFDWPRKGKTLYEMSWEGLGTFPPAKVPSISGEPQRIGDDTTPRQHADNAALCELVGAGGCLHGGFSSFDASHDSDLQNCKGTGSENAMACARAVRDVWKSNLVPASALQLLGQHGFVRGTENNDGRCPVVHWDRFNEGSPNNHPDDGQCRTYFLMTDTKAYGLSVDPAPGWKGYETREGWRIVRQGGFIDGARGGNFLHLAR